MIDYNKTLEITFVITQKCNIKCWYCYWNDEKDIRETVEHDFNKVIEFIKVHKKKNLFFQFYGGEPTLHPKLIEYADRLNEEFDNVTLLMHTNLLRSKKYYEQFNKYDDFLINCSFHSDWVKNVDEWFEKVYLLKNSEVFFMLQENNTKQILRLYYKHSNRKKLWICPIHQILGTETYKNMKSSYDLEDIYEHSYNNYKNQMCKPGFIIRENGDIMRCWAQMPRRYKIFNIYKDPMKHIQDWTFCVSKICFCDQAYPRMEMKEYYRLTHGK